MAKGRKGKAGKRTAAEGRKRHVESKSRWAKILKTKAELPTVQNQLRISKETTDFLLRIEEDTRNVLEETKKTLAIVQQQLRIETERRISLEGEVHMLKAKVKQAKGLRLSEAEKLLLGS